MGALDARNLEWFDILARGLFWAAAAVLALSVIGAILRLLVADRRVRE